MVNGKKLVVSASPHLRSTQTTTRIMLDVVISLIPALIAAIFIFDPEFCALRLFQSAPQFSQNTFHARL